MTREIYDIAPYVQKFHDKVFVIKLGGEVLDDAKSLSSVCKQLRVVWQLGIHVVVVHGAGVQLDRALKESGHEPRKVQGRRVTDEIALEQAKRVMHGSANLDLVSALCRVGLPAVGLSGVDACTVTLRRRPPVEIDGNVVDFGFVGDPVRTDPALMRALIDKRFVPVVCSLGADADYQILNINADPLSTEIAVGLQAAKLIFVSDKPGILHDPNDEGSIYSVLDLESIEKLMAKAIITGGMIPKVKAGVSALKRGVERVHIIGADGGVDSILEETFTNQGCGTMLVLANGGPHPPP